MIAVWQLVQVTILERLCTCQKKPEVVIAPGNDEIREIILSIISICIFEEARHCCTRTLPRYLNAGVGSLQVVLRVWQAM